MAVLLRQCAPTLTAGPHVQLQRVGAHDGVGRAAQKLWPVEVITDRYHCLGSRRDASLRSLPCSSQAATRSDCSSPCWWASGHLAASSRRMVTASSIAVSASSRRPVLPPPQLPETERQVVQRPGQVGPERVRAGRGQLPADAGGFLDRGQRVLPPAQVGQLRRSRSPLPTG